MSTCGTNWGYIKGCRCDDCKKAHRDYQREYLTRPEARQKHIERASIRNKMSHKALMWVKKNHPEIYYEIYDQVKQEKTK
jgi:hypothetical protein